MDKETASGVPVAKLVVSVFSATALGLNTLSVGSSSYITNHLKVLFNIIPSLPCPVQQLQSGKERLSEGGHVEPRGSPRAWPRYGQAARAQHVQGAVRPSGSMRAPHGWWLATVGITVSQSWGLCPEIRGLQSEAPSGGPPDSSGTPCCWYPWFVGTSPQSASPSCGHLLRVQVPVHISHSLRTPVTVDWSPSNALCVSITSGKIQFQSRPTHRNGVGSPATSRGTQSDPEQRVGTASWPLGHWRWRASYQLLRPVLTCLPLGGSSFLSCPPFKKPQLKGKISAWNLTSKLALWHRLPILPAGAP